MADVDALAADVAVYDLAHKPQPGTLYGLDRIESPDLAVWCDSAECADVVASCGYPQAVALVADGRSDLFAPLKDDTVATRVAAMRKIIVVGQNVALLEELARRLGRHRVWRCAWPDACNDAADTLQHHGAQAVRDGIENAEPYPIEGINYATEAAMLGFRHAPAPPVLSTGCAATDQHFRLPGEGKIVVVTGIPNHGKSSWVTHVMVHTAMKHGRRWAIFSPEFGEWQHLGAAILAWRAGKPFRPVAGHAAMTDTEIAEGADWCASRFSFLACDGEDDAPTLDWILERARACVLRDGATDLVIDPWNEIEHDEGGRSETSYIGRALQRLRGFASRHGCNVWIVAHPTKLKPMKPGDPVPVPTA